MIDLQLEINFLQTVQLLIEKKRIGSSGDFRLYHIFIFIKNNVYLVDLHPKTGKKGKPTLTKKEIKNLFEYTMDCIEKDKLLVIEPNKKEKKLNFKSSKNN